MILLLFGLHCLSVHSAVSCTVSIYVHSFPLYVVLINEGHFYLLKFFIVQFSNFPVFLRISYRNAMKYGQIHLYFPLPLPTSPQMSPSQLLLFSSSVPHCCLATHQVHLMSLIQDTGPWSGEISVFNSSGFQHLLWYTLTPALVHVVWLSQVSPS